MLQFTIISAFLCFFELFNFGAHALATIFVVSNGHDHNVSEGQMNSSFGLSQR